MYGSMYGTMYGSYNENGDRTGRLASYASSAILLSLFVGGDFYYRVVSVNASILWVYAIFAFPKKKNRNPGAESAHGLGRHMLMLVVSVARVSIFLACLVHNPHPHPRVRPYSHGRLDEVCRTPPFQVL